MFQSKQQQYAALYVTMALYRVIIRISGKQTIDNVKTYDELEAIGKESNNDHLGMHLLLGKLYESFYYREYNEIMELCEMYPSPDHKRVLNTLRCLFEGVAALNLARQQPNESKYRTVGEQAVRDMAKFEQNCRWNFENKSLLLQAELHYLNKDYKAAEAAYVASIKSGKDHKFIHEEAMAHELFGIYYLENDRPDEGRNQLNTALDRYKQWGAVKKAADLEHFIGQI